MRFARHVLLASFTLTALPALAHFEPTSCKNAFTVDQEIAEGNKVVAQVYATQPVLPDSDPVSVYVRSIGRKLVANTPPSPGVNEPWPYDFHVVASSEINAFALPGGTMFVNLATVQAAESEAQLAGVMAHELSHVVQRHSTCNITKQRKKSLFYALGALGAGLALGNTGGAGLAQSGIGMAQGLDYMHMSRDDEKQADLLGTDILYDAGYDPRGLPQFFEIIQSKYGSGGSQMLSDHPNPGNRVEYVNAEIATLPPREKPVVTTDAFRRARAQAATEHALTAEEIKAGTWKSSGSYVSAPTGVVAN